MLTGRILNYEKYGEKKGHVWKKVHKESRGRVVTRWPGSQEVGGSIPGCATKFVRCKNLAFNIGECLPWLGYHVKLLVPCISGESSLSM